MSGGLRLLTTSSLAIASLSFASAASGDVRFWRNLGDIGGPVLWVAGLGSSLVQDGHNGLSHAARTADGFIASLALCEGLKYAVQERRPYSGSRDSFPSLHSTLSFEVAAAQSYYHPKQSPFWYAAAAVIGYSRIPAHEHHWQDVIAGAALGYGAGQLSVSSRHGWFIAPLVERGRVGATATASLSF